MTTKHEERLLQNIVFYKRLLEGANTWEENTYYEQRLRVTRLQLEREKKCTGTSASK